MDSLFLGSSRFVFSAAACVSRFGRQYASAPRKSVLAPVSAKDGKPRFERPILEHKFEKARNDGRRKIYGRTEGTAVAELLRVYVGDKWDGANLHRPPFRPAVPPPNGSAKTSTHIPQVLLKMPPSSTLRVFQSSLDTLPPTDKELVLSRKLFRPENARRLIKVTQDYAVFDATLADEPVPEVVFCGRGNTGKSTMLSAITLHRKIVQASQSPGHTRGLAAVQVLNRIRLVDTPGYGHASQAKWGECVVEYFQRRRSEAARLERVMLLVDIRRGLMDCDKQAIEMLESFAVPYQIVFTKIDLMTPHVAKAQRDQVEDWLVRNTEHCVPRIMAVCGRTGDGMELLRVELLRATAAAAR